MQSLLNFPKNNNNCFYLASKTSKENKVLFHTDKNNLDNIPDLKQFDIPGKEEYYCGPVSAADGIIMLAQRGFYKLYPSNNPLILIEELASHFKTDKNGTTTNNMCNGLESFIKEKGYNCKVNYQGLKPVDSKYRTAFKPDLNWIKSEINKHNLVILNLGAYKKKVLEGKTVYTRYDGHLVPVIGYGHNGLNIDPNYLTILDPYDKVKGVRYIKANPLDEGKFIPENVDNEPGLINDAKGFYEISPKFNYYKSDDAVIINGAISLEVKE